MATETRYVAAPYDAVVQQTPDAVQIRFDDDNLHWLPWSLIEDNNGQQLEPFDATICVALWKVEELEIHYE